MTLIFSMVILLMGLVTLNLHLKKKILKEKLDSARRRNSEISSAFDEAYCTCMELDGIIRKMQSYRVNQTPVPQFTQEDLRRMKHYLHPDKHGGKTDDLFVKISKAQEGNQ